MSTVAEVDDPNSRRRSDRERLMDEALILQRLHHPCVIDIHDVSPAPARLGCRTVALKDRCAPQVVESDNMIFIVLELVTGGELYDRLAKKPFPEQDAKCLFFQVRRVPGMCRRGGWPR